MTPTDSKYINRELSWLEFNQRVLEEAQDASLPVLERLKFLAITASNLDEFFMVRVGGLQTLTKQLSTKRDPAGMLPDEQLQAISRRTHEITRDQYLCFLNDLEPKMREAGIVRLRSNELTPLQAQALELVFQNEIFSVLTPMAVSSAREFPLLINRTLSVCVQLRGDLAGDAKPRFAVIPFGRAASRFVTLPSAGGYAYMLLEDVVAMYIERFFPGEDVIETVPFRITRNAELELREDMAADLLAEMEEILDARTESPCVRLEVADRVTSGLLGFLKEVLNLAEADVYATPGPLDLSAFMKLTDLQGFDALRYEPWPPRPSAQVDPRASMFENISQRDILLVHPYESFEPVVRLIEEAAEDPDVLAIKQTLYRTSRDSQIVAALMKAAENDKYVTAIVELKARFDEARNIEWARNLEQAGGQVIYGVKGLKTHAKVCIIVRREAGGVVRYVHFGTGNYNESTARLYSDVSYLTRDEDLGADAISFFNAVTGYSQPQRFRQIEAAPIGMREKLIEMIETEVERKKHGQKAQIIAKLNSLVDPLIIDALYSASQAGVKVQLNIRGICCLRPGVPDLSDNITVVSIVDRFLEHSRIVYFHHGGDERIFISSADWMPRNLDRRVELLVPIVDATARDRLIGVLETYFRDTVKGRKLDSNGTYKPVKLKGSRKPLRSQETLYHEVCQAMQQAEQSKRTVFEPHRATGTGT